MSFEAILLCLVFVSWLFINVCCVDNMARVFHFAFDGDGNLEHLFGFVAICYY